jgi:hypothetical protein
MTAQQRRQQQHHSLCFQRYFYRIGAGAFGVGGFGVWALGLMPLSSCVGS